ncbi:MAG: hypothetical protein JWQ38_1800 [Flavipsychrobacter sp.]|nr:hypothetical protein [Flavipsychrobacter sp.]
MSARLKNAIMKTMSNIKQITHFAAGYCLIPPQLLLQKDDLSCVGLLPVAAGNKYQVYTALRTMS